MYGSAAMSILSAYELRENFDVRSWREKPQQRLGVAAPFPP